MRNLAMTLATLALAACATKTGPQLGTQAPTVPAAKCAPTVAARSEAEPLMPAGVDLDALHGAMIDAFGEEAAKAWRGWLNSWRGWGQEGWRRLDAARAACR